MNLTHAELTTLRTISANHLAAQQTALDVTPLAANVAILQAVLDHLPVDAKPGIRATQPADCTDVEMTNDLRRDYTRLHHGTGRLRVNCWAGWQASNIPLAPVAITDEQKADLLVVAYVARFQWAIQISEQFAPNTPALANAEIQRQLSSARGLVSPMLKSKGVTAVNAWKRDLALYYGQGGTKTFLECIDPPIIYALQLSFLNPEWNIYRDVDPHTIPQRTFIKWFLYRYANLDSTDRKEVEKTIVKTIKMLPNSTGYLNIEDFDRMTGEFLQALRDNKDALSTVTPKRLSMIYVNAIVGDSHLKENVKVFAEGANDEKATIREANSLVNEMRASMPTIERVASFAARNAASATAKGKKPSSCQRSNSC